MPASLLIWAPIEYEGLALTALHAQLSKLVRGSMSTNARSSRALCPITEPTKHKDTLNSLHSPPSIQYCGNCIISEPVL
jgi:hypothetical protein